MIKEGADDRRDHELLQHRSHSHASMSSSRSQPRISFASLTPNNLGIVRRPVFHCLEG